MEPEDNEEESEIIKKLRQFEEFAGDFMEALARKASYGDKNKLAEDYDPTAPIPPLGVPSFENTIKLYRKRLDLTQEELAMLCGFKGANRIIEWESGTSVPNITNLAKLCCILDVPFSHLYPALFDSMEDHLVGMRKELMVNKVTSEALL